MSHYEPARKREQKILDAKSKCVRGFILSVMRDGLCWESIEQELFDNPDFKKSFEQVWRLMK